MDPHIEDALVKTVNILIRDAAISNLLELVENTSILLHLIKTIEPDARILYGSNEENLLYVCKHVNDYLSSDVVNAKAIMLKDSIEIGKLICLMVYLFLTSRDNDGKKDAVENIQSLPNETQFCIMNIVKVVENNFQEENLAQLLQRTLCSNKSNDEKESTSSSPFLSHQFQPRSFSNDSIDSPKSPVASFFSPQNMLTKVMVENKRLRKSILDNKYEEKLDIAEKKIFDLKEMNHILEKERDTLKQKILSLEEITAKLNKNYETLNQEFSLKEEQLSEQIKEKKELRQEILDLQIAEDNESKLLKELKQKQILYEGNVQEKVCLSRELKENAEQFSQLKEEYGELKVTCETMTSVMEKMKGDHADYVSSLKEEITILERQKAVTEESESLRDAMKREEEMANLKKDLQETKEANLCLEEKREEQDLIHKKLTGQYMDQISALIKQVEEQTHNNECLNEKVFNSEEKCKVLEKQMEACAENARKSIEAEKERYKLKEKEVEELKQKIKERDKEFTGFGYSVVSIPDSPEELDSPENDHLLRAYSLRRRSEHRRSFQPRRYLSGNTPPHLRTLVGDPAISHMSTFSTEISEEPEELDNMGWNMIASLQESDEVHNLSDDEKSRVAELQRRNTLCLPHLRSAYPAELSVLDQSKNAANAGGATKRKLMDSTSSNLSAKKKRLNESTLSTFSSTSTITNSRTRLSSINETNNDVDSTMEVTKAPVSFEISFDPPVSAVKPKLTRSRASTNLQRSKSGVLKETNKGDTRDKLGRHARSEHKLEAQSTSSVNKAGKTKTDTTKGIKRAASLQKLPKEESCSTSSVNKAGKTKTKTDTTKGIKRATSLQKLPKEESCSTSSVNKAGKSDTFSRGGSKRSSFTAAKNRMRASLRNKK